ncbi:MAG: ABC transporter permease [Clostridia bacterium]|nr:ABC transporter permease [Clostridia bacterium]
MNNIELDEINRLPTKYRPMGAWSYFGYQILFSIPLIGFIALLVCAFSDTNINRRSFARSYFCVLIIAIIIAVILVVALGGCAAIAGVFN